MYNLTNVFKLWLFLWSSYVMGGGGGGKGREEETELEKGRDNGWEERKVTHPESNAMDSYWKQWKKV